MGKVLWRYAFQRVPGTRISTAEAIKIDVGFLQVILILIWLARWISRRVRGIHAAFTHQKLSQRSHLGEIGDIDDLTPPFFLDNQSTLGQEPQMMG